MKTDNTIINALASLGFQWDAGAECYTHLKWGTLVQVYTGRGRTGTMIHIHTLTAEGIKSKATFTNGIPTDAVISFIATLAKENQ